MRVNENRSRWREKTENFYSLGCYEEALEIYEEILALYPDDEKAQHYKGDVLYLLNHYEEAIKAYEDTIRSVP